MSEAAPIAATVGWWQDGRLSLTPPAGVCYAVCLTIEAERALNAAVAAAVAAERDRCAKLCEVWMTEADRHSGPEAAGWLHQVAAHMRNPPAP